VLSAGVLAARVPVTIDALVRVDVLVLVTVGAS
jgi:hydrogenase-4 membrane subunit HyfE